MSEFFVIEKGKEFLSLNNLYISTQVLLVESFQKLSLKALAACGIFDM